MTECHCVAPCDCLFSVIARACAHRTTAPSLTPHPSSPAPCTHSAIQYIQSNTQAVILVERESQAPIVLGRGGAAIKGLGSAARTQIEEFLGRKVFLQLSVQVGWVLGVGGCLLHAAVTAPKKDTG